MQNFIAHLRWRNMIHDMVPGTEEHLNRGMATGYAGFDPSASSLHLGNLAAIMLLKHFQETGHRPIAIVGGATSMIGDPSWRAEERTFITEEQLRYNERCIGEQLKNFLDFTTGKNKAILLNNLDWFKDFALLNFLRDIGKHMPIGYMMAKDSVKKRIETGISYTEFAYQLLQGYDFYHLHLHHNVTVQMGGADQWGNLTTGVELIRKKAKTQVFAVTAPLLTRPDGTKFGKTATGKNIWLDGRQTTPYALYQFIINLSDNESEKMIKVFAFCSKEEIAALIIAHKAKPETRLLQQTLAKIITTMVHSEEAYKQVRICSNLLFGATASIESLHELSEADLLTVCEEIPQISITQAELTAVDSIMTLLSIATKYIIISSKSEAKRMIASHAIFVNKILITDPYQKATITLLHNRYLLVQKGKKNYYLIVVQ